MFPREPKSHQRYILYRIYVALILIAEFFFAFLWMTSIAANGEPSGLQTIGFFVLFPFFGVAVFMVMSAFVFPFEYSILGDLERTPFPNEQPILKIGKTWGQIGYFRGTIPFFSWYVYPSGLGISILGIGKVFIPTECIKSLNEDGGSFFSTSRYQIVHTSPEVNGPIYLPDKELFDILSTTVGKGGVRR